MQVQLNVVPLAKRLNHHLFPFVCDCLQLGVTRLVVPIDELLHHFDIERTSDPVIVEDLRQPPHGLKLENSWVPRAISADFPVIHEREVDYRFHKNSLLPPRSRACASGTNSPTTKLFLNGQSRAQLKLDTQKASNTERLVEPTTSGPR